MQVLTSSTYQIAIWGIKHKTLKQNSILQVNEYRLMQYLKKCSRLFSRILGLTSKSNLYCLQFLGESIHKGSTGRNEMRNSYAEERFASRNCLLKVAEGL